jgi:hypothetical protein
VLGRDSEIWLRRKLYDKNNDFNFPIMNFPFICSMIPAAPAYGVYISQLIRYSRACISFQDFLDRGLLLTRKLLNQGFLLVKLKSLLRKFYGRHHDLVDHYGISVSQITMDMFHLSYILPFSHSWLVTEFVTRLTWLVPWAVTAYPSFVFIFTYMLSFSDFTIHVPIDISLSVFKW